LKLRHFYFNQPVLFCSLQLYERHCKL